MNTLVRGGLLTLFFSLPAGAVDFRKDVLPILENNCIKCHKDGKEKGDLNLQAHKLAQSIGSGKLIQPGKPHGGLFIKVIESEDPDNRMPPKGSPLSQREIQVLKTWITQGAELGLEDEVAEADPDAPQPLDGTWTNTEGKALEATLLKVEDGKAHLRTKDGKVYPYPIDQLSEESQARIREWGRQ